MAEKNDALDVLAGDHRKVEELFGKYEGASDPEDRTEIVHTIIHELAVHGEIEELLFYPRLREAVDGGDRLADEAVSEHLEMKQTLNDLDSLTAEDDGFDDRMQTLMREVRHHVQEEESELFPRVREALSVEDRRDLGESLEGARSMVPTRPHPKAPTSPGGKAAAGGPAALIDRVRDAIRGSTS